MHLNASTPSKRKGEIFGKENAALPSYGFEIRIRVARDSVINSDAEALVLASPATNDTFVLKPTSDGIPLSGARDLAIEGQGFDSLEAARSRAEYFKRALLLCGAQLRIGIDTVVNVFEEEYWRAIVRFKMPYAPDRPPGDFRVVFEQMAIKCLKLSDKQTLALELYNAYHFESSPRTRFLTLVIAIESLAVGKRRSSDGVRYVETFIEQISNSKLPTSEKESLVGSLGYLKDESIGRTCRQLVAKYLVAKEYGGFSAKAFFQECYEMRSQLVHDGTLEDTGRYLEPWIYDLDEMVSDLLLASAESE